MVYVTSFGDPSDLWESLKASFYSCKNWESEIKDRVPGHGARLEPGPITKGASVTGKGQEIGCSPSQAFLLENSSPQPREPFPTLASGFCSAGVQPSWGANPGGRRVRICTQVCGSSILALSSLTPFPVSLPWLLPLLTSLWLHIHNVFVVVWINWLVIKPCEREHVTHRGKGTACCREEKSANVIWEPSRGM